MQNFCLSMKVTAGSYLDLFFFFLLMKMFSGQYEISYFDNIEFIWFKHNLFQNYNDYTNKHDIYAKDRIRMEA